MRGALAQYIIRNTSSLEKLAYNQEAGTVSLDTAILQGSITRLCPVLMTALFRRNKEKS